MRRKNIIIYIIIAFVIFVYANISEANTTNIIRNDNTNIKAEQQKDVNYKQKEYSFEPTMIIKYVAFSAIVSTVVCVIIGFKHKPVKNAQNANQYLDTDSVNITNGYDHFTKYTISKQPINRK